MKKQRSLALILVFLYVLSGAVGCTQQQAQPEVTVAPVSFSDYEGTWLYFDKQDYQSIQISLSGVYSVYDTDGEVCATGRLEYKAYDQQFLFYEKDSSFGSPVEINQYGLLETELYGNFCRPDYENYNETLAQYTGNWYQNRDLNSNQLILYPDNSWRLCDRVGKLVAEGIITTAGPGGFTLWIDGEDVAFLIINDDGSMGISILDSVAVPTEDFSFFYREEDSSYSEDTPYADRYDLIPNYDIAQMETFPLSAGGAYYVEGGPQYGAVAVNWQIGQDSYTVTEDGIKEIAFTAICSPASTYIPGFVAPGNSVGYHCNWAMFDYYTGYQLFFPSLSGDADMTQNVYNFTYPVQGEEVSLEVRYSTKWQTLSNNTCILTMQMFVRMPQDYDGLVFSAFDTHFDYASYAASLEEEDAPKQIHQRVEIDRLCTGLFCPIR